MWHKADWDKVKQNPESIQMPREDWIHFHDAEVHAEEVVGEAIKKFSQAPSRDSGPSLSELKLNEPSREAVPVA